MWRYFIFGMLVAQGIMFTIANAPEHSPNRSLCHFEHNYRTITQAPSQLMPLNYCNNGEIAPHRGSEGDYQGQESYKDLNLNSP